jgi:hypothetical protein
MNEPTAFLLSDNLDNQLATPGTVIKICVDDLLPGAESQASGNKGDCQRSFQQSGAHVAVPVAISPGCIVSIGVVRGDDLIKKPLQIADNARFIFDGRHRTGGGGAEDREDAILQSRFTEAGGERSGDIVDIGTATGRKGKRKGFYTHRSSYVTELVFAGHGWQAWKCKALNQIRRRAGWDSNDEPLS